QISPNKYDKMNSFGEYLRNRREKLGLPLRKVAAELDIDTSILSKIERSERVATKEMLPTLAKTLDVQEKEIQIEFIQSTVLSELGDLEFLADGLKNVLKQLCVRSSLQILKRKQSFKSSKEFWKP